MHPAYYGALADALVLLHLGFILFAVGGAWLAFKWKWISWLHLPTALWAAVVELAGWICPLTPLENELRYRAGGLPYSESFVEHYLMPLVYPSGLTRELQIGLGLLVLALNLPAYYLLYRRRRSIAAAACP